MNRRRSTPAVRGLLVAFACTAATAPAAPLAGQSPATGSVEVMAASVLGSPLGEVQVQLIPAAGGDVRVGIADRAGVFAARLLAPGTYSVLAERLGYQPVLLEGVPVVAGRNLAVPVTLERAEGPVRAPVVVAYAGALAAASRPGTGRLVDRSSLGLVQDRDRLALDALSLATRSSPDLDVEGLPAGYAGLVVDGLGYAPALHPALGSAGFAPTLYPLDAAAELQLLAGRPDLQWPASAGGLLAAVTRAGPAAAAGATGGVYGQWESDALGDEGIEGLMGVRGGFDVGAAFMSDSARVRLFGTGFTRDERYPLWTVPTVAGDAPGALYEAAGASPGDVPRLADGSARSLSLGGRFDWRYGEDRTVELATVYAVADRERAPRGWLPGLAPAAVAASDLITTAGTTARLAERWRLEVRGGFARTVREYGALEAEDPFAAGPALVLSGARAQVGVDPAHEGRFERTDIRVAGTVHMDSESYLLQAGLGGGISAHDRRYGYGRNGVYVFGGPEDLTARTGLFFRLEGAEPAASFSTQALYAFLQNTWRLAPGLDVRTGLRYDLELLPAGDIQPATEWRELTGLDNASAPDQLSSFGLLAGFEWDVQQRQAWLIRGDFSVRAGELPAELMAEALTFDGRPTVRRFAGTFDALDGAPVGEPYRRLTLLDPDLRAPLTSRASLGVARALGARTTLLLGGAIRRTENLPTRTDLNVPLQPVAVDQHGRPVYGVPRLAGGLLVSEPGTGRRFTDYDVVSAIASTGVSDYRGVTIGLERRGEALDLGASYTLSSTTDDLPGAIAGHEGADLSPFPSGEPARDWTSATSDLDVPHRLVLAADLAVPGLPAVRVGGTYRLESGRPFTPGFTPGTDVAGLGAGDPAFVDESLEGMDLLVGEWDCLRESLGAFAARNACRAPDRATLDLRLAAGLSRRAGFGAEIVVEALNVVSSGHGWIDTALLLPDPDAASDLDIDDGAVSFPFRVNPSFGSELLGSPRAFQLRAGLRLRF